MDDQKIMDELIVSFFLMSSKKLLDISTVEIPQNMDDDTATMVARGFVREAGYDPDKDGRLTVTRATHVGTNWSDYRILL